MTAEDTSFRLMERIQNGDSAAAGDILERYTCRLVGLIRQQTGARFQSRFDPEDVVQSGLRSFFFRATSDQYVVEKSGDLWRLLAQITLNKLRRQIEVNLAQRRTVAREQTPADWNSLAAHAPGPAAQLLLDEQLERLFQSVSPDARMAIGRRLAGDSIAEIAVALERSERTIRRWLQEVRDQLQQELEQDNSR